MKAEKLKQTKYVFLIGFALLGLVILLTTTLPNSFQYYLTVTEYKDDFEKYKDIEVKLAGHVVPGTIIEDANNAIWKFQVFHEDATMNVYYQGAMPDTFNDEAEVVLTGTFQDEKFVANHVLAKCASRYEEKLDQPLELKTETQN